METYDYGGSSTVSSMSNHIYTDAGTPFNWDQTVYNSGEGTIGTTS